MNEVKRFVPIAKKYFNYLLKLGFKEFFINVIELLLLVIMSCLVYIPIGMVRDILVKLFNLVIFKNPLFFNLYQLFFTIVSALVAIYVFVRFFNKRYEDISEIRKDRKEILYNNDNVEEKKDDVLTFKREELEEFDLPKQINNNKKKKRN